MVPGFRQVPYNDLEAMRAALSPATAAILIEGIQGEGGVTPATPEYLLGLRQLCDEKKLLLLMDERAMRPFPHRPLPELPAHPRRRAGRRDVPAGRHLDGQVAGRRLPHRRVLGAGALRRFAGRGLARHDLRRLAARLRGRLEDSRGDPAREAGRQRAAGRRLSSRPACSSLRRSIPASSRPCAAWA